MPPASAPARPSAEPHPTHRRYRALGRGDLRRPRSAPSRTSARTARTTARRQWSAPFVSHRSALASCSRRSGRASSPCSPSPTPAPRECVQASSPIRRNAPRVVCTWDSAPCRSKPHFAEQARGGRSRRDHARQPGGRPPGRPGRGLAGDGRRDRGLARWQAGRGGTLARWQAHRRLGARREAYGLAQPVKAETGEHGRTRLTEIRNTVALPLCCRKGPSFSPGERRACFSPGWHGSLADRRGLG